MTDIYAAVEAIARDVPVAAADGKDRHRLSAAVGRLLKRLHVRHLVTKVPRSRGWRVTETGRRILRDTVAVYRRYSTQAA